MGRLQPFQHLISLFLVAASQASVPLCPLGWAVGAVPVQLRHPQVVPTLLSSMGQPAGHVWGCLAGVVPQLLQLPAPAWVQQWGFGEELLPPRGHLFNESMCVVPESSPALCPASLGLILCPCVCSMGSALPS